MLPKARGGQVWITRSWPITDSIPSYHWRPAIGTGRPDDDLRGWHKQPQRDLLRRTKLLRARPTHHNWLKSALAVQYCSMRGHSSWCIRLRSRGLEQWPRRPRPRPPSTVVVARHRRDRASAARRDWVVSERAQKQSGRTGLILLRMGTLLSALQDCRQYYLR